MLSLGSLSKQQLSAAAVLPLCLAVALIGWATGRRTRPCPGAAPRAAGAGLGPKRTAGDPRSPAEKLRKLLAQRENLVGIWENIWKTCITLADGPDFLDGDVL